MIRRALGVALFAALVFLRPPGQSSAQLAGEPYEVPVILSLTGQSTYADTPMQQSLVLIAKAINAGGGIQGHPLKLVPYDDGSNPQTAVALAGPLIAKNVPLIFGPGFASTCQAVAPLTAGHGPVALCYSPLMRTLRGSYMFVGGQSALNQYRAYLRYFRDRGWTRLAFLMSTDASGQAAERAYGTLLDLPENKNFQIVSSDHFNPTALSVEAQIQHIRSAHPDVLVSTATGTPFGTILRAYSDAGLSVPVASSAGNLSYPLMEQYKAYLPAVLLFPAPLWIARAQTPAGPVRHAQQRFFRAFDAAGIRLDVDAGVAWDLTLVALEAVRHIGIRATPEQIRDYMENVHGWVGINGVYDFGDAAHRGMSPNAIVIGRWDPRRNDFVAVSRAGGRISSK